MDVKLMPARVSRMLHIIKVTIKFLNILEIISYYSMDHLGSWGIVLCYSCVRINILLKKGALTEI